MGQSEEQPQSHEGTFEVTIDCKRYLSERHAAALELWEQDPRLFRAAEQRLQAGRSDAVMHPEDHLTASFSECMAPVPQECYHAAPSATAEGFAIDPTTMMGASMSSDDISDSQMLVSLVPCGRVLACFCRGGGRMLLERGLVEAGREEHTWGLRVLVKGADDEGILRECSLPSESSFRECMAARLDRWSRGHERVPGNEALHQGLLVHPGFGNSMAVQRPRKSLLERIIKACRKRGLAGIFSVGCGDGLLERLLADRFPDGNVAAVDSLPLHPAVHNVRHDQRRPDAATAPAVPKGHALLISFGVPKLPWRAYAEQKQVRSMVVLAADSASTPNPGARASDAKAFEQCGFSLAWEMEVPRAAGGNARASFWDKKARSRLPANHWKRHKAKRGKTK